MIITSILDVDLSYVSCASLPGQAARSCYGKRGSGDYDQDLALTRALYLNKHFEPFECSLIMFECVLPKFVCSQLNRHRVGIGRCQQSLRLSFAEPTFFWPSDVPVSEDSQLRFENDERLILQLRSMKAKKRTREILQRHICDHVMVQYSTWFNAREWLQLKEKRMSEDAQPETKKTIGMMQDLIMTTNWKEVF